MAKVRTQLYLEESQKELLDGKARQTGKSLGQLVREAVDEVYFKAPPEKPLGGDDAFWEFVGAGESPETDISARHDHYLYDR